MTTYRRCMSKTHPSDRDRFYLKADGACPHCGDEFAENKALRMSKLNNQLWGQVEGKSVNVKKEHDIMTKRIKKEAFG